MRKLSPGKLQILISISPIIKRLRTYICSTLNYWHRKHLSTCIPNHLLNGWWPGNTGQVTQRQQSLRINSSCNPRVTTASRESNCSWIQPNKLLLEAVTTAEGAEHSLAAQTFSVIFQQFFPALLDSCCSGCSSNSRKAELLKGHCYTQCNLRQSCNWNNKHSCPVHLLTSVLLKIMNSFLPKKPNYFCRDSKIFSVPTDLVEVTKSECHKSLVTFPVTPSYENDMYKLASAEHYKLTEKTSSFITMGQIAWQYN